MDIEQYLGELAKFCDPYSILAFRGKDLIRIHVPFKVMLMVDYEGYIAGETFTVDKIMITRKLQMVYVIIDQAFPARICQILLY
jgi:hypothetical protein